ncbi:MAG: hypothetical protein HOE19_04135 [Candidatus Komeilibacteria bacterium]|jgi:hypothetical protein|nr:hypothetical protein [Candidatus Komeilibacteria bacterium]MBT4447863.1 hypothetical protein [Candidatus Komeilibacteria bacterium]
MEKSKNYELLKSIINEEDPLGLVDSDTPESLNEYDPEIEKILEKDIVNLGNEELRDWIHEVFVSFFNEELVKGKDKYDSIANKFINALKNES